MGTNLKGIPGGKDGALWTLNKKKGKDQEFPSRLVVKTAGFHCRGHRFSLWFGELGSHMPRGFYFSQGEDWNIQFSSVQSLSRVRLSTTPWIAACQASLSITNSRSSLRLTSIESVMLSSHLIFCLPLLLLPPIPPSIRVFSNESTLRMRWSKYWSFNFSIIPSKEIPGLISFRMDWLDLLAVQGTLKSLLQHHSSKAHSGWKFTNRSSLVSFKLKP